MYRIKGWFPEPKMNGGAFGIVLTPKWKEAVEKSSIDQQQVNNIIKNLGPAILESRPGIC